MEDHKYSKHSAGVKTLWVIDFEKKTKHNKKQQNNRPAIEFHSISSNDYSEMIQQSFYVDKIEEDKPKENTPKKQLDTIQELCDNIETSCNKSMVNQSECQETSEAINDQIKVLGSIIQKFNAMLDSFKKKKNDD